MVDLLGRARSTRQPAAYRAAGSITASGAPLETMRNSVALGMTPAIFLDPSPSDALGPAQPNPLNADPIVTAVLSQIQAVLNPGPRQAAENQSWYG
jgi:hypothetical protein